MFFLDDGDENTAKLGPQLVATWDKLGEIFIIPNDAWKTRISSAVLLKHMQCVVKQNTTKFWSIVFEIIVFFHNLVMLLKVKVMLSIASELS